MDQTIYPSMWDGDSYVTVGDVFNNPTWGTVIKLTQSLSPTILNETSINVNGNTINITPGRHLSATLRLVCRGHLHRQ